MRHLCPGLVLLALTLAPSPTSAQALAGESVVEVRSRAVTPIRSGSPPSPFAGLFQPAGPSAHRAYIRACEACPPRRPAHAVLQTLGINLVFNLWGRLRDNGDEYKVTPPSWWEHLRNGFEWDYSTFYVNQAGHPYQGSLYFNAGRANGLSFWESAPLVALGSATWEYFAERNHPSLNDFVTTTVGGIAVGEVSHRVGWLIRDTRLTGRSRLFGEILATVVDPVTGLNRFASGDASRVSESLPGLNPVSTTADVEGGVQWAGEVNGRAVDSVGQPFLGLRLGYNDIFGSPFHEPYDAFSLSLRAGGGATISQAAVRGRLYGRFLGDSARRPTQFLVAQAYDFEQNGIFEYGGQSVLLGFSRLFRPSDSVGVAVFGMGGPILLGAIRSALVSGAPPAGEGAPDRTYDFGPGATLNGGATLRLNGFPLARAAYTSFFIHTASAIKGPTGEHHAQVVRLDLLIPLWRNYRLGLSGDYLHRDTHYGAGAVVHWWLPQIRVYLARVTR